MNFLLVTLFAFFLAVQASPLFAPRTSLDVYSPTILTPNSSTTWCAGFIETVMWDTSNAPHDISNRASIVLVYSDHSSPSIVLVEDFSLLAGSQDVKVPENVTSGTYTVILFGDSANKSPTFSIVSSLNSD